MATILQTIFCMKVFLNKFGRNSLWSILQLYSTASDNGLVQIRQQVAIWTNEGLVYLLIIPLWMNPLQAILFYKEADW